MIPRKTLRRVSTLSRIYRAKEKENPLIPLPVSIPKLVVSNYRPENLLEPLGSARIESPRELIDFGNAPRVIATRVHRYPRSAWLCGCTRDATAWYSVV